MLLYSEPPFSSDQVEPSALSFTYQYADVAFVVLTAIVKVTFSGIPKNLISIYLSSQLVDSEQRRAVLLPPKRTPELVHAVPVALDLVVVMLPSLYIACV